MFFWKAGLDDLRPSFQLGAAGIPPELMPSDGSRNPFFWVRLVPCRVPCSALLLTYGWAFSPGHSPGTLPLSSQASSASCSPQQTWWKVVCREIRQSVIVQQPGPDRGLGCSRQSGRQAGAAGATPSGMGRAEPGQSLLDQISGVFSVSGALFWGQAHLCLWNPFPSCQGPKELKKA